MESANNQHSIQRLILSIIFLSVSPIAIPLCKFTAMVRNWYYELRSWYYDFLLWSASSRRNGALFVLLAVVLLCGFLLLINRGGSYPGPVK